METGPLGGAVVGPLLVPSLPMRDGNDGCDVEAAGMGGVPSLPMRDGNYGGKLHFGPLPCVPSLPMRDGNCLHRPTLSMTR